MGPHSLQGKECVCVCVCVCISNYSSITVVWKKEGGFVVLCVCAKLLQLCPTLCDPVDCSPPGSSVHGILQARILEWVAVPSSRGSSWPRDQTCVSYVSCIHTQVLYHYCHLESTFFDFRYLLLTGARCKELDCRCRRHKRQGLAP